jgi:hypothetical protein
LTSLSRLNVERRPLVLKQEHFVLFIIHGEIGRKIINIDLGLAVVSFYGSRSDRRSPIPMLKVESVRSFSNCQCLKKTLTRTMPFSLLFRCFRNGFLLVLAVTAVARASDVKALTETNNPPPTSAFSTYSHFEVKPIAMGAPFVGQSANDKALIKIQQNFDLRLNPLLKDWGLKADAAKNGKTLVLEPSIVDIKFINGTARVWAGALAGSSGVILKIRFVEKESGAEIATPQFYQRANGHGGAFSFGATDNNMLVRITEIATSYISSNYSTAVGGPTGVEAKK